MESNLLRDISAHRLTKKCRSFRVDHIENRQDILDTLCNRKICTHGSGEAMPPHIPGQDAMVFFQYGKLRLEHAMVTTRTVRANNERSALPPSQPIVQQCSLIFKDMFSRIHAFFSRPNYILFYPVGRSHLAFC